MKNPLTPLVIALVFVLDRVSKYLVLERLAPAKLQITPFFSLSYVENTGVAFGMLPGQNTVFIALTAALVGGLLFWRKKIVACGPAAELGLALVLGGALGNFYDRVVYGFVVDFFDFSFFPAVFNVGDSAITCGAFLLAWATQRGPRSA